MMILNRRVPEELIEEIIRDIKKKKELVTVSDKFVKDLIIQHLSKDSKLVDFLIRHEPKTLNRSEKYRQLIKDVRAVLRKVYGVFQKQIKEREKYLAEKDYVSVLKSHLSTKERLPIYKEFYEKLWKIIGKPDSIIDLACGMNPFSFRFMGLEKVRYFASELSGADVEFIQEYFDSEPKIDGKAEAINLLDIKKNEQLLENLPKSDVCFLFKVLDPALVKTRKTAEKIIVNVPANWVVVSFSTKTISGRTMKEANRSWIKRMCERLGFSLKELSFSNEMFYIIKKD